MARDHNIIHAAGPHRESAALLGSEFRLCGHRSAYFTHTYSQGGVASVQLSYAYDLLHKFLIRLQSSLECVRINQRFAI